MEQLSVAHRGHGYVKDIVTTSVSFRLKVSGLRHVIHSLLPFIPLSLHIGMKLIAIFSQTLRKHLVHDVNRSG